MGRLSVTSSMLRTVSRECNSEAAISLGITTRQAAYVRRKYSLPKVNESKGGAPRKVFAEDVAQIFELMSEGLLSTEICLVVGGSSAGVRSIIRDAKSKGFDAFPKRPV